MVAQQPRPAIPTAMVFTLIQRESVWPDIELFVRMGMRPAEVRLAVQRIQGTDLDAAKIATAFGKRTRKGMPLREPAERRQARQQAKGDAYWIVQASSREQALQGARRIRTPVTPPPR